MGNFSCTYLYIILCMPRRRVYHSRWKKMVCLCLNWSKSKFRTDGLCSSTLPLVPNLIRVVVSPKRNKEASTGGKFPAGLPWVEVPLILRLYPSYFF